MNLVCRLLLEKKWSVALAGGAAGGGGGFFLMIRRPPRSTRKESSAASDVYKRQIFDFLDAPVEKINTADTPAPYSPVLLAEWLPNSEDVIKAVKKVMYVT